MTLRETSKGTATTDILLTIFTGLLVGVNLYLVLIVGKQLDSMRKDERAWIYPRVASALDISVEKQIIAASQVLNSGKTAAAHVDMISKIEILTPSETPSFDYSDKLLNTYEFAGLIVPNQRGEPLWGTFAKRRIPGTATTEIITFTPNMVDAYNHGQLWIAVEGILRYQDAFNHWHETAFCAADYNLKQPTLPEGAKECAAHNYTDNN